MSYDRRTRDRFRLVVTGVTGAVGVTAVTLTGLLMGLASRDYAEQQADQQATNPTPAPQAKAKAKARQHRAPKLIQRPHVTRVTVRYVTEGSSNPVGSGGSVTSSAPSQSSQSSQPAQAAPEPAPDPAPAPEPEPAPAPSSGS